jgi:hypothetical protein
MSTAAQPERETGYYVVALSTGTKVVEYIRYRVPPNHLITDILAGPFTDRIMNGRVAISGHRLAMQKLVELQSYGGGVQG